MAVGLLDRGCSCSCSWISSLGDQNLHESHGDIGVVGSGEHSVWQAIIEIPSKGQIMRSDQTITTSRS